MEDKGIRINKFLSEAGVCSRREADRQVEAGKVVIDGRIAAMGDKVFPGQKVEYNGKPVIKEEEMILIALNKPAGIAVHPYIIAPVLRQQETVWPRHE